jgi:hypothetical protein
MWGEAKTFAGSPETGRKASRHHYDLVREGMTSEIAQMMLDAGGGKIADFRA